MAVAQFNLATAGNNADAASYATASISPTANRLVLAWFVSSVASGSPNIPVAIGNSLTWVVVTTRLQGTRRMTLFRSMGASPITGTITFDLGGQTADGAQWSVAEFSGVNTSGTHGAGAISHKAVNSVSGATSLTATLSTFADTDDATAGAFFHAVAEATNVGSGFTQIGTVNQASPGMSLTSEFLASNDTSVDASWTTSAAAIGIVVAIREASSPVFPMVYAAGAISASLAAVTPAIPLGTYTGDLLVMFIETNSEAITVSGWTEAASSHQEDATDTTRLTVFYRWAVGENGDTPSVTSDSGNHQIAAIVGIYGAFGSGNPFDITAGTTESTSDTSVSIPGATTTVANTLVLAATTSGRNATASNEFSGWTNASLTAIQEWIDGTDTVGLGGGIGMASGLYPGPGTYNATTATAVTATRKALWSGAIKPANYPPTVALNTADSTDFDTDTTPTLEFTGTDPEGDDVRYTIEIGQDIDIHDSENFSGSSFAIYDPTNVNAVGQSFVGIDGTLGSAQFLLAKAGSPTADMTASIYAHSGTFGTNSVPTGSPLATSDAIASSTLTTTPTMTTFTFSGANQIALTAGTYYVVTIESSVSGFVNYITVGVDSTAPAHAGNSSGKTASTWGAAGSVDLIFKLSIVSPASTLTKVSGTDLGFLNTVDGADTDPFTSGQMVSYTAGVTTTTYYFDGSDAAATDPNSIWTDDANAFDGSTSTYAISFTSGSTSSNFLKAEGTNAPGSGETIMRVRARMHMSSADGTSAEIYTDGLGELLGTATRATTSLPAYGSYVTLSIPTGGWTWAKLQALEVKIYRTAGVFENGDFVTKVELEVAYPDASFGLTSGTYHWRVKAIDPSGINTYGTWTQPRHFTVTAAAPPPAAPFSTAMMMGV